jgi:hypothetical protein
MELGAKGVAGIEHKPHHAAAHTHTLTTSAMLSKTFSERRYTTRRAWTEKYIARGGRRIISSVHHC